MFYSFIAGIDFRRHILASNPGPRTERVTNLCIYATWRGLFWKKITHVKMVVYNITTSGAKDDQSGI